MPLRRPWHLRDGRRNALRKPVLCGCGCAKDVAPELKREEWEKRVSGIFVAFARCFAKHGAWNAKLVLTRTKLRLRKVIGIAAAPRGPTSSGTLVSSFKAQTTLTTTSPSPAGLSNPPQYTSKVSLSTSNAESPSLPPSSTLSASLRALLS